MGRRQFWRLAVVNGWKWASGVLDHGGRLLLILLVIGVPTAGLAWQNRTALGVGIAAAAVVILCLGEGAYRSGSDLAAAAPSELDLAFEKVAAHNSGQAYDRELPGHPVWLVCIIVRNHGPGGNFAATVVSRSMKGLLNDEDYPQGDFHLRWQVPEMATQHPIVRSGNGRLDVAWVFPTADGVFAFLGPGNFRYNHLTPGRVDGIIEGLIDVIDVTHDATQRVSFRLSVGTAHPVDLSVTPVAGGGES